MTDQSLAKVDDVIEHGQDIPANVVRMTDEAAVEDRSWRRVGPGRFEYYDSEEDRVVCEATSNLALDFADCWPMTVVEVDPEPQPACCTVADDVAALRVEIFTLADKCAEVVGAMEMAGGREVDAAQLEADALSRSITARLDRIASSAESGPVVLSLPQVFEVPSIPDAVTRVRYVGAKSGIALYAVREVGAAAWTLSTSGIPVPLAQLYGLALDGRLTDATPPPPEPRTWPKLDEVADWPEFVEVVHDGGTVERFNMFAGRYRSDTRQGYWSLHELRQHGEVREVLT